MSGKAYNLVTVKVKADRLERDLLFEAMRRHDMTWEEIRERVQAACADAAHVFIRQMSGSDCAAAPVGAPEGEPDRLRANTDAEPTGWFWRCGCGDALKFAVRQCPGCGRPRPDLER